MPTTFAFYRAPGDWRDRLIRAATCSPYSHVELLQAAPMAGEAMCISASKRDGNKVRTKRIAFKPGHWDFINMPNLCAAQCWRRATMHLDAPYDTIGAILTVTPIGTSRRGNWFCSELLGHAADIPQPHTLTPGTLAVALLSMGGTRSRQPSLGGGTH